MTAKGLPKRVTNCLAQRSGRAKDPAPAPQAGEHTPHTVSSPGQRCARSQLGKTATDQALLKLQL